MKAPDLPEEKPSAPDKRDYTGSADYLADSIKTRQSAWHAAHRLASEIPGFSGRAKHLAVSLLLA